MKPLHRDSPAKLNLGLEVLRKRHDGYHDIHSVFVAITFSDIITVESANELSAVCEPAVTMRPEENLVYKAASALLECANVQYGAKINLHKNIPTGSGLGGGSSNAATVLSMLSALWSVSVPLDLVALQLGSDVPFFLNPRPSLVQGRGEVIHPLSLSLPWHVLLVMPGVHFASGELYYELGIAERGRPATDIVSVIEKGLSNQSVMATYLRNDFEVPAFRREPALADLKERLYHSGAFYASLTGSGSALYGLYTQKEMALEAESYFAGVRTRVCSIC